jgi:hypothetical protein
MNYFLYLIGVAAILLAVALLLTMFNPPEVQVSSMTPVAMVASFITGIVMCALGRIIGLLKKIARNTARDEIASQF